MQPKAVLISKPRATNHNGNHRVTADVAGQEVWFESRVFPLPASSEAFGSALLIPALYHGAPLRLAQAVCPKWQVGAGAAARLAGRWWQLPPLLPEAESLPALPATKGTGTALCFTGGLDSFHCLLRGKHRPDWLVFIHGYDIELADEVRLRAFVPSLEQVAVQCGARAVVVTTNLRTHPLVRATPWIHAHGGALAAIGHLLSEQAGQLVIASSVPRTYDIPWGSHWQLDPLWSSGVLTITHEGDDFSREQKAWALANEPLLHHHLRVCWENRSPTGNCSVCDKCVNAMLLLQQAGQLESCSVFQKPQSFVRLLDALPQTTFVRVYRAMCQRGLPPEVEAAVQRLLQRTGQQAKRHAWRKRIRSVFGRVFRRGRSRSGSRAS
jgi:hypothetical protein